MTIGLPRLRQEAGDRRAFLPRFVKRIAALGVQIVIENGYGAGMGIADEEYRAGTAVRFGSVTDCYGQEIVLVLRYPRQDELSLMQSGSTLVSMVHLETRPGRRSLLRGAGLDALSLDCVRDDIGRRLVENLRAVGWNGLEAAFDVLETSWPRFADPTRDPVHVLLLGAGSVGLNAVAAAVNYGRVERRARMAAAGCPGVEVRVVDYDVVGIAGVLERELPESDIVVDATRRTRQDDIVIRNALLTLLPPHAVLVDLSVDPYDCTVSPPAVKAIEGMPQGDLDRYVFDRDDPAWDAVPSCAATTVRRTAVSCYSWPGVHPRECMEVYGKQVFPLIRVLVDAGGPAGVKADGTFFHRAISRALLSRWED